MKQIRKKMMAAAMTLLCTAAIPQFAAVQVLHVGAVDSALVLDAQVGLTYSALYDHVHAQGITGYVALNAEKLVEVVCNTAVGLENVQRFAAEQGLDSSLIVFRLDENLDLTLTDGGDMTLADNAELEQLVRITEQLNGFIQENGWCDTAAYASLQWYRHAVSLFVRDEQVRVKITQFLENSGIDPCLVDVIVSPEYEFAVPDGGQKGEQEVNLIVASEYFAIQDYLQAQSILSNIFLALAYDAVHGMDVTCIEVYVRTQADADTLTAYMTENGFWQDVVSIKVTGDLTPDTETAVRNKAFVVQDGDANDDGTLGIADLVILQQTMLGTKSLNERQAVASDLSGDQRLNTADLTLAKRMLLNEIK